MNVDNLGPHTVLSNVRLVKISLPFPYPVHPFLVGQLTSMFHIEVPYCVFELQVPLIPSVLEERSRSWFVR
jgi:hypothetical protein